MRDSVKSTKHTEYPHTTSSTRNPGDTTASTHTSLHMRMPTPPKCQKHDLYPHFHLPWSSFFRPCSSLTLSSFSLLFSSLACDERERRTDDEQACEPWLELQTCNEKRGLGEAKEAVGSLDKMRVSLCSTRTKGRPTSRLGRGIPFDPTSHRWVRIDPAAYDSYRPSSVSPPEDAVWLVDGERAHMMDAVGVDEALFFCSTHKDTHKHTRKHTHKHSPKRRDLPDISKKKSIAFPKPNLFGSEIRQGVVFHFFSVFDMSNRSGALLVAVLFFSLGLAYILPYYALRISLSLHVYIFLYISSSCNTTVFFVSFFSFCLAFVYMF